MNYNELRHFSTERYYRYSRGGDDRYCQCELCGGTGSVYALRNIFSGALQVVDGDTYWETPCDEEDCDNQQSEWRQWDDMAECPECDGTGYVDTRYDSSSHDVYCKGDEDWE